MVKSGKAWWTTQPMLIAYSTVPKPTVPPSIQPTPSTASSIAVRTRLIGSSSVFKIAGDSSDALLGLGEIEDTAEAGGYIGYQSGNFAAKLDVRQALSGGQGLIATLGLVYVADIPLSSTSNAQAIKIAMGPRLSFVDDKYNQTYFGVTAIQSARSGLRQYDANGGLLSAGFGLSAHIPLTERISGAVLVGYDRLTGDAARAPLVENRGSRNQATVGLGLTYKFGL